MPGWMIAAVAVLLGLLFILYVRRKVRRFSRRLLGSDSLLDGLARAQEEADNTPRSLSGGDAIYLPQILREFPEFNAALAKSQVQAVIAAFLEALERADVSCLPPSCGEAVIRLAESRLADARDSGTPFSAGELTFHNTTIARYLRSGHDRTIRFQTAFAYRDGGGRRHQEKAELTLTYTLTDEGASRALRCAHCGAPVSDVGVKVCAYCGNGVIPVQDKVWQVIDLRFC